MTIALVCRSGGIYTPSWVGKLVAALAVYAPGEKVVCLTDFDEVPCEKIALRHNWPGWFAKCEMFEPGVLPDGQCVYLDLDVVVTGPLAPLLAIKPEFAGLRGLWGADDVNTSVLSFQAGGPTATRIWNGFSAQPEHWIKTCHSDQDFITNEVYGSTPRLQDLLPNRFVRSYKEDCTSMTAVPEGLSLCVCHGSPKAPDFAPHYWLRKAWERPGR